MARKLNPDEAEVFQEGHQQPDAADVESFLRQLNEKQNEELDLTLIPGKWFRSLHWKRTNS